jgi:hypothetical protein
MGPADFGTLRIPGFFMPLEGSVLQRQERQPPLMPTGKDPCLSLFPGDDVIRILAIFFETPIKFVWSSSKKSRFDKLLASVDAVDTRRA